jgi:hypothetical protein
LGCLWLDDEAPAQLRGGDHVPPEVDVIEHVEAIAHTVPRVAALRIVLRASSHCPLDSLPECCAWTMKCKMRESDLKRWKEEPSPCPKPTSSTREGHFERLKSTIFVHHVGFVCCDGFEYTCRAVRPGLEFAYVLNVGTVHEGTPFSRFSIFASPTCFFGIFFYKIGIYNPDFCLRRPIPDIHSMGRGSLIFEGAQIFLLCYTFTFQFKFDKHFKFN